MNDKAQWETPELERIGHAGEVRSGEFTFTTEGQVADSAPSGPS